MGASYSKQKIRLISGESVYREQAELVGFCHSKQHPGFLVKSIVKRKGCLEKHCSRLEPFPEQPFWISQKAKAQTRAQQKEEKKQALLERKQRQAQTLSLLQEIMSYANWLIDAYSVPLLITGVSLTKQDSGEEKLIVNYVTDQAVNDSPSFCDFEAMIGQRFQKPAELRHTRMPDGRLATTGEFEAYLAAHRRS